jgi:hypothetical protein
MRAVQCHSTPAAHSDSVRPAGSPAGPVPARRGAALAVVVLAVVAIVALAAVATRAAATWRPPVGGPVARAFDLGRNPFEAGRHRGIDLVAPPGTVVGAPCGGRVVVAGRVGTSGRVVTLRCGPWRVSHMPFATIAVRRGAAVARGTRLGTVTASGAHAGLHVGVRREGTRFGYVDPLRFLAASGQVSPLVPGRARRPARPGRRDRPARPGRRDRPARPGRRDRPARRPQPIPLGRAPRPVPAPRDHPARRPPPVPLGRAAGAHRGSPRTLAPWPAWAGLALVLAGVGLRWRGAGRPRTRGVSRRTAGIEG